MKQQLSLPKLTIFILITLFAGHSLSAQILQPVKWNWYAEAGAEEGQYDLYFEASIEPGWHLYSQNIDEGGPIPTGIYIDTIPEMTYIGPVEEIGEIEEKYDANFEMELRWYSKEVTFKQTIILSEAVDKLTGYLQFMTCDDERCLPPEYPDFELSLSTDQGSVPDNGLNNSMDQGGLLEPVKWKFRTEDQADDVIRLIIDGEIDEGWYVYSQFIDEGGPVPTSFSYEEPAGIDLLGDVLEAGPHKIEGFDNIFEMDVIKYADHVTFTQDIKLADADAELVGYFEFMTCNDKECLAPAHIDFKYSKEKGFRQYDPTAGEEVTTSVFEQVVKNPDEPLSSCTKHENEEEKGFITIFLLGLAGGFIALLTPCVFPMIPMTVTFFTKRTNSKGLRDASMYGFFIVFIYFLLSVPFLIFDIPPDVLNQLSTNVYLNLLFFVIFVVFAISFFGYFEIMLPHSWVNKADQASEVGGAVGIFFMALTLALVSFSCTGPILGSLLVGALTSAGGKYNLVVGMVGFGFALSMPFTLFAAFPKWLNSLPKSGGWLNSVKVILAFLELALALKFLSNADLVQHWGLLKREIFLGLWMLIGIAMIAYVMGWIKFPHDSPVQKIGIGRIAFSTAILAFVIYLGTGLMGSNLKLLSGFPPPIFYSIAQDQDAEHGTCPHGLQCFHDFEDGMQYAAEVDKPVIVDFTGWACVNCRRMEENVWVDGRVYDMLSEEYVLISLYVDDREELPEDRQYVSSFSGKQIKTVGNLWSDFQASNFNSNSQPYYVLISPDSFLLSRPVGYTPDAAEYLAYLQCGKDAFESKSETLAER